MIMATLSAAEREEIAEMFKHPAWEVIIAFDPIDQAFKFKVDQGIWSPPFGAFQTPDNTSLRSFVSSLQEFINRVATNRIFRARY
jgi:hypothetical protein